MKLIFSRKGFDSAAGGYPSPIVDGVPVSLPIPAADRSLTTYGEIGLGDLVERVTGGALNASNLCHCDPMFENGRCAFGQAGAAQGHLSNSGVSVGDLFLFFGLFSRLDGGDRHHRLFGFLRVEEVCRVGAEPGAGRQPEGYSKRHPHTIGRWPKNNCVYIGRGMTARHADEKLRLSWPTGAVSHWRVPPWLRHVGLTYHGRADRWVGKETLRTVGRGQEFVADIGNNSTALAWAEQITELMQA